MSWSFGAKVTINDDVPDVLRVAAASQVAPDVEGEPNVVNIQIDAAIAAAVPLLDAIGRGREGVGDLQVTLSGHANPGNLKRSGWSNDGIYVSVSQS